MVKVMKMIKNYLISLAWTMLLILGLTLLLTIFNYFNIINNNITNALKLIIPIISIIIGSYKLGKRSNQKGYLEGIKFGSVFLILTIIFNLIVKSNFEWKNIIFYIIIILSSMIGAMIGIQKNKDLATS